MARGFVTVKITAECQSRITALQDRVERAHGFRVSESKIIEKALDYAESHPKEFIEFMRKPYGFSELIGIAPSVKPSLPEEKQDDEIYGT